MTELVAYELDGWDARRMRLTGTGLLEDSEVRAWARLGVVHGYGPRCATVTSYRHDDAQLAELRRSWPATVLGDRRALAFLEPGADLPSRPSPGPSGPAGQAETRAHCQRLGDMARLVEAAANDELVWEQVTVPVNGALTRFELTSFGPRLWLALGRAGDADVTIDARGVEADGTALVPFRSGLPPWPEPAGPPAGGRTTRFPASELTALAPLDADDQSWPVELVYRDARLVGSVGGAPVDMELEVPRHTGQAAGTFNSNGLDARWRFVSWTIGDRTRSYPAVSSSLQGSFAGQPAVLDAVFHLSSDHAFDHGTVSGHIAGGPVDLRLEAADGGLCDTGTVAASGTFAGAELSLYATVAPNRIAHVRGRVGTSPMRLDAIVGKALRVRGTYLGPRALLAGAVGALLWFT